MKTKLLSAFVSICCACVAIADNAPTIDVTVSVTKTQPIQQNVLGINCELLPHPIGFTHPSFMERYRELGRPIIRYPGGTSANYYNPLKGFLVDAPGFSRIGIQNERIRAKTGGKGDDYREFFRFVKANDAPYSVTMNVATMSIDENSRWLEELAEQKISPLYFELGNELFYNQYSELIANGADYVARAKKMSEIIRRLFPAAKIAVIVPDSYTAGVFLEETKPRKPSNKRYSQWEAALQGQDFYDAVAVHAYSGYGMKPETQPADFLPLEKCYHFAISEQDHQLAKCLDEVRQKFPGRPIWMSEYDLGGWSPTLRQYPLANSYLGSLHSITMLLKLVGRAEVTMADRNTYLAFLQWTGAKPAENGRIPDTFTFEPNILFKHFQLMGMAIRECDTFSVPALSNVATYNGASPYKKSFPEVEAGVFLKDGRGYLILINKLNRQYRLGKITGATAGGVIQYAPRQDVPLAEAVGEKITMKENNLPAMPADFALPPYSITRIAITGVQRNTP